MFVERQFYEFVLLHAGQPSRIYEYFANVRVAARDFVKKSFVANIVETSLFNEAGVSFFAPCQELFLGELPLAISEVRRFINGDGVCHRTAFFVLGVLAHFQMCQSGDLLKRCIVLIILMAQGRLLLVEHANVFTVRLIDVIQSVRPFTRHIHWQVPNLHPKVDKLSDSIAVLAESYKIDRRVGQPERSRIIAVTATVTRRPFSFGFAKRAV